MNPTVRLVDVGNQVLRIDYRRTSSGAVPLLLCNGIGANLELWEPFVGQLRRPTITFDSPGVGSSPVPLYPPTIRGISRILGRLLDRLKLERVDVLGLSWGGALAQEIARREPERVRRLVLAATTAGWTAIPASPRTLARMMSPRRYRSPDYLHRIAADLYGGEVRSHPAWLHEHGTQRFLHQATTRGYVWQLLAGRRWTSLAWLHRLTMPTLVLSGDDDPIIPLFNARLLASRIPNARLHVVPGGGHLFLLTRAAEYAGVIAAFLDEDERDVHSSNNKRKVRLQ